MEHCTFRSKSWPVSEPEHNQGHDKEENKRLQHLLPITLNQSSMNFGDLYLDEIIDTLQFAYNTDATSAPSGIIGEPSCFLCCFLSEILMVALRQMEANLHSA